MGSFRKLLKRFRKFPENFSEIIGWSLCKFLYAEERARREEGDRMFLQMIELLGHQNLKMVESLEPKFATKGLFFKILAGHRRRVVARRNFSLRSQSYIIFKWK